MGSPPGPIPPAPTNDGGLGSDDVTQIGSYTPMEDEEARWNYYSQNADQIAATVAEIHEKSGITEKTLAKLANVLAYVVPFIAGLESSLIEDWVKLEADVYANAAAPLQQAGATEAAVALQMLITALGSNQAPNLSFNMPGLGDLIGEAYQEVIAPFTLVGSELDPTQPGAGFKAQDYLLERALALSLQEWIIEQLGQHMGMGFFKTLGPFLNIIEHSVNPSNIVRQAMEASYAFMVRAPLTRDLNRKYPMKDLGASALARLYLRGAIDQNTYNDRCLNLGLSIEYAQQLLLEAKKQLSRGDVAKLLSAGYITETDATNMLTQMGYSVDEVPAILWLDTHQRYFTAQERVGQKALTAWTRGQITQTQLESILQDLHFTADEIAVYEIEAQFEQKLVNAGVGGKALSYSQVRAMYEKNIIGVDEVLTFLQNEGYSQTDVINLILLDFTKAEEYQLRTQELTNRMRVAAESARVSAATEATKNETALANAKTTLANELEADAKAFGDLLTAPTALQLLGLG